MCKNNSVKIPQIDCKDIYLSNQFLDANSTGYRLRDKYGQFNTRRFRATLDYSLELIKLREIYYKEYGRNDFSVRLSGKDYSRHVASITFNFSIRKFNRANSDTYIREDRDINKAVFVDCLWIDEGELVGVQTGRHVETPAPDEVLGKSFEYRDGCYRSKDNFGTVKSVAQLREWVYQNGFWMDGIHFIRYKRSAGSSRVGKCLFIDERLYPAIHKWEMCGLEINNGDECDLAAIESYISLTMSSIIGAIEIKPENILLINDYESTFRDDVVVVREENGHLTAVEENIEITNNIWDGQSLIDKSLLGEYDKYGFVLLRNNFFKSAAFNTNLQEYFRDHDITRIEQLNGQTVATDISQIKLITTPSSIKYLKFGSFESWLENISSVFGVVKHEKKTHYWDGRMVKVHYQLINSLQMSEEDVKEFMRPTLEYLHLIKTDVAAFRRHINFTFNEDFDDKAAISKCDVVYKLLGISDEFAKTKIFYEFKRDAIHSYVSDIRLGHIMVNGNYSTMVGNPIEMLEYTIGQFDGQSQLGIGCVHTKRFEYGKVLLGSRSPQPAAGNLLLTRNVENIEIDQYLNLTEEIVAVNSIDENLLNRLSGADFDSDTMLMTDNETLIRCARRNYDFFKVPTSDIHSKKKKRKYNDTDKSSLDVFCKTNAIGQIVNLSSELNSYIWEIVKKTGDWTKAKEIYLDVALLSSLSGVAIDMAKKEFNIDCIEELEIIRKKYDRRTEDGRQIKPNFFAHVARKKGYYDNKKKSYVPHKSSMDYIQTELNKRVASEKIEQVPFSSIIDDEINGKVNQGIVNLVLSMVRDANRAIKEVWACSDDNVPKSEKVESAYDIYQRCINGVDALKMSHATMKQLLMEIEKPENSDIKRRLWTILFGAPNKSFYQILKASKKPVGILEECSVGEAEFMLFGFPHKKIYDNEIQIEVVA